jgi:ubiquinol-cytochrome c reductase cytochrome b subunit
MNIVKRVWAWIDDRSGFSNLVKPVLDHPVPPGSGWSYVFGSAALAAFILQVITGMALATSYVTSAGEAYNSLKFITDNSTLVFLLRGMHFYGASAMILMVGLHMIQVFLVGSYKFPRELNWLTGIVLLGATVALGFTGQLLRWDDIAVWSVFVASSMAARVPVLGNQLAQFIIAGDTIGGATLSRFFAFHVFFLPAVIFGVVAVHLTMVLYHGISEPPKAGRPVDPKTYRQWYHDYLERFGVPFWPDAAWRDIVFGIGMIAVIMILAIVFGPPQLGAPPDPSKIDAYPRPDWYFLWFFAALAVFPAGLENYLIILGPLLVGLVLVLLPFVAGKGERSWRRRPWAVASVILIVLMIGSLWRAGERAPWSPHFDLPPAQQNVTASQSALAQQGALLFRQEGCQFCHTFQGVGGVRGPNLTNIAERISPEVMTTSILAGRNNMPSYAHTLTPDQVRALVAFLQSTTAAQSGASDTTGQ